MKFSYIYRKTSPDGFSDPLPLRYNCSLPVIRNRNAVGEITSQADFLGFEPSNLDAEIPVVFFGRHEGAPLAILGVEDFGSEKYELVCLEKNPDDKTAPFRVKHRIIQDLDCLCKVDPSLKDPKKPLLTLRDVQGIFHEINDRY